MKKYLIVLAAALVTLASCDPEQGKGNAYTSIKFKQTTLNLAPGESARLNVIWEPAELDAPTVEWATSNAEVATVSNGIVTAVAIGNANITAKLGELSAQCQVTVEDERALLEWAGLALYKLDDETVIGEPYQHWDEEDQVYYLTQNIMGHFMLWDNNITLDNEGYLNGAGYLVDIPAPVAIIQEGQWKGYYYSPEMFVFADTIDATKEGACPAGALTDAEEWYKFLSDSTYKGDGSFKGAAIEYDDFDNEEGYLFQGFVKDGILVGNKSAAYYQMNVVWLGGAYGLAIDEEGEPIEPAQFAPRTEYFYELLPEQNEVSPMKTMRTIANKSRINELQKRFANTKNLHRK